MQLGRRRPLARELASGSRLIVAAATLMVVAVLGMLGFALLVSDPNRATGERALAAASAANNDLFTLRSDVRAFTFTGDSSLQQRYVDHRATLLTDLRRLRSVPAASLRAPVAREYQTAVAWLVQYGDVAMRPSTRAGLLERNGGFNQHRFARLSLLGQRLSSAAQNASNAAESAAHHLEEGADAADRLALIIGGSFLVAVGVASALLAASRSRRLVASFGAPVAQLLTAVQSVGRGEFAIQVADSEVTEIADLADGIADMATSLRLQQKALSTRAEQAQRLAERLRRVLGFAREVSSSLTMPTVLATISRAACQVAGTNEARVWLVNDAGQLSVAHGSSAQAVDPSIFQARAVGDGVVGRAAATCVVVRGASGTDDAGRYALPLVSNGRGIGVLEVVVSDSRRGLSEETLEVLEFVTGQGATAIEAARLYQHTERLSLSDPLTGLGNRRRLDNDLELEIERAVRYGRPMTLLMLDVDHFKAINDTHGHAHGDVVLQDLARVISEHMRSVDTAYRYGGEELAVLARETDVDGGLRLAERLREAVERSFTQSRSPATVSIGIANAPANACNAELLFRAADRALYQAKRAGRNRVAAAACAVTADLTGRVPTQS